VLSTYSWKSVTTWAQNIFCCSSGKLNLCSFLKSLLFRKPKSSVGQTQQSPSMSEAPLLPPCPPLMPTLSSNNTFTVRGALAPAAMVTTIRRNCDFNCPLPPVPTRNPDHIKITQGCERTDPWRRGETIV